MKYLKYFLVFLFIPFIVQAEECNINNIIISSIESVKTNGYIEEKTEASVEGQKINLDLKVYEEGDSIEYKVILNNISNEDYYFDENSLKQNNEYMSYEFIYDDNSNIIKPKEEKELIIRVTYKNKVQEESNNGSINKTNNIKVNLSNKELPNYTNSKNRTSNDIGNHPQLKTITRMIENPNTEDKIVIIAIIPIIILISMAIIKYVKKRKFLKSLLIIPLIMIIPITVYAICKCDIELESNIEIDVKEATFLPGPELNIKMKELAGNNNPNIYSTNESIESIIQSEEEPTSSNKEEKNIVSIPESKYPIYMWFDNGRIYWWSEDKTPNLNEDSSSIFSFLFSLNSINGIKNWDSSQTQTLNELFSHSKSLRDVDALNNWNTSNVTDLDLLFNYSSALTNIDGIKNWDVSKVITMRQMICGDYNIETIDLSNWETSSLKDIINIFGMWGDQGQPTLESKLKRIVLSEKFNTSKVEQMVGSFANLPLLEDYSFLKYFDTSNTKAMNQMFLNNNKLTDTSYMEKWDVSKVENMSHMFYNTGLTNVNGLDNWKTSNLSNMNYMFFQTPLNNVDGLINWDISKVTTMYGLFSNNSLTNVNGLSKWDTSNVTNMTYMFMHNKELLSIEGLRNWDVSSVEKMDAMFADLPKLADASPINDWNIDPSGSFTNMFYATPKRPTFTKVPGRWNGGGTFIPS